MRFTDSEFNELLKGEQARKQNMVQSLETGKTVKERTGNKKRIAKRIDAEIAKIIEEERKRALKSDMTPEQKLIGENFQENKGRLPWPVERGIVTSHFGVHQHPVLKYVTEENKGIEITSNGKINARSVFKVKYRQFLLLPVQISQSLSDMAFLTV